MLNIISPLITIGFGIFSSYMIYKFRRDMTVRLIETFYKAYIDYSIMKDNIGMEHSKKLILSNLKRIKIKHIKNKKIVQWIYDESMKETVENIEKNLKD